MDGLRFDALTRGLARPASRRATVKGAAAGLLGLVLGRTGVAEAVGERCNRDRDCGNNEKCCNGRCRDTLNDPRFCGSCTNDCRGGANPACRNGTCVATCRGARAGICDISGCGPRCGCNFVANDLSICESTAERCSALETCTNDNDCPSGRICVNEGCCNDKPRVCVRPCATGGGVRTASIPVASPSPANRREP